MTPEAVVQKVKDHDFYFGAKSIIMYLGDNGMVVSATRSSWNTVNLDMYYENFPEEKYASMSFNEYSLNMLKLLRAASTMTRLQVELEGGIEAVLSDIMCELSNWDKACRI